MSPTQRSLQHLRKYGYKAFVVEKYNSFARIRIDFGNYADILAYKRSERELGVLAIQTTTSANASSRLKKIEGNINAVEWLASGNRIHVHAWSKMGARGERKLWALTIRELRLGMDDVIYEK